MLARSSSSGVYIPSGVGGVKMLKYMHMHSIDG